jgi:hypothetical protein
LIVSEAESGIKDQRPKTKDQNPEQLTFGFPMEQLVAQFLEHLRYERNVSSHTVRNYQSDLEQFLEYLAPAQKKRQTRITRHRRN